MSSPKDLNSPSSWNMRIWDCEKNQWLCDGEDDVLPYYGFDIRGGEVTAMQSMDWVYRQFEHGRKLIWERSTGLTDKNGKEIYEGDIVEWVDGLWEKHIFEIIWNECRASFQMVEIGQEYPYILQGLSDKMKPYCEVIGNIHESNMEELCQKE